MVWIQFFHHSTPVRLITHLFSFSILLTAFICGILLYLIHHPWVDFSRLRPHTLHKASILLDDEGIEWARFERDQRDYCSLDQLPTHLIQAFLATEDRSFYNHHGISWTAIIRSLVYNIRTGRFAQGASTITQQLVKLFFFDTKKTLIRKIKEQFLACMVEQQFSKEQILEAYLNTIYFGCGIYGIAAATNRFWGIPPSALTLEQSATLAGIVRAPSAYCPLSHPDKTVMRRNTVLHCMEQAGYITQLQAEELCNGTLTIISRPNIRSDVFFHLRAMAQKRVEREFGTQMLYEGGLTIKTTINRTMQTAAMNCFQNHITSMRNKKSLLIDGALVSLDATGAIKALVGGTSPFNRATQARRQCGSIIKPLLYAVGNELGIHLYRTALDESITVAVPGTTWQPHNATRLFEGEMTFARALMTSNNIVAIKLLGIVGPSLFQQYLTRCGLTVPHAYSSLALGCLEATPLEVAALFALFNNKGVYQEPHYISWIKDASGNIIWRANPHSEIILSWESCSIVSHLLEQAVNRWKQYTQMPPLACAAFGKTGTTDGARNCWFAGATPLYTTLVYLGNDDNRPLNTYAVRTALPLWLDFNNSIPQAIQQFSYPPHLVCTTRNAFTGALVETETVDCLQLLVRADVMH